MINALHAAANASDAPAHVNLFSEAAEMYERTQRNVVFVSATNRRLDPRGKNSDGPSRLEVMGRTMPNSLFRGPGDILISDLLGAGDFVMTAAHEMLAHDDQKVLTDISPRIDGINDELWTQLPETYRPSAKGWKGKLGK